MDLKKFEQTNVDTGAKREIRRRPKPHLPEIKEPKKSWGTIIADGVSSALPVVQLIANNQKEIRTVCTLAQLACHTYRSIKKN